MNIEQLLQTYSQRLKTAAIPSARLDCLILLEDATGKDRAWLLAHPEYIMSDNLVVDLDVKIARRSSHEPLAYIRGTSEFYGRSFYVDHNVLEPRPESEAIIDALKAIAPTLSKKPTIVDVGTGSGALVITAKLEFPAATVYGTDIDPHCLTVAARNATQHTTDITLILADLLEPISSSPPSSQALPQTLLRGQKPATLPTPDIILANLPYVPEDFPINQAASHEPRLAIFGGSDGLDLYRKMFDQLGQASQNNQTQNNNIPLQMPRCIITEALPPHHGQLAAIAEKAGYRLQSATGFIQVFVS